jgi:hypothetical protein
MSVEQRKENEMKVKDLIERLERHDSDSPDSPIQFYFLDNYNLEVCEIESIYNNIDGEQVEITIQPYNTDRWSSE